MTEKAKIETGFSSDAKKEPRRIVFITRNTSAKVTDERGPQLMTYPHLLVREAIVFEVLVIVMGDRAVLGRAVGTTGEPVAHAKSRQSSVVLPIAGTAALLSACLWPAF